MSKTNVATLERGQELATVPEVSTSTANMLMNNEVMCQLQKFAEVMASGKVTTPKHLQGSTGDCLAIAMQAAQWGMNPFAVAQKTHLVNGTLGYEAQLVNAVISSSRSIKGRFHYEYAGDWDNNKPDACVRVGAVLAGENAITWGEPLYPSKVTTKNSPLWKTAPKQQAAYLAVKYWARMYCPDVILGVYTADELHDQPQVEKEINPSQSLAQKLGQSPSEEPDQDQQPQQSQAHSADQAKQAQFYMDSIDSCGDLETLQQCGDDIEHNQQHGTALTADLLKQVRAHYARHKKQLKG